MSYVTSYYPRAKRKYSDHLYNLAGVGAYALRRFYQSRTPYKPYSSVKTRMKRGRMYTMTKRKKRRKSRKKPFNRKQYKALQNAVQNTSKTFITFNECLTSHMECKENQCQYASYQMGTRTQLEQKIDGEIKKVGAGGAQDIIDHTLSGRELKVVFNKTCFYLECRNNNNVPVKVWYWKAKPTKRSQNKSLGEALIDGLNDRAGGALNFQLEPNYWPQHATNLMRFYKFGKMHKKLLQPGEEFTIKVTCPRFIYSADESDSNAADFQYWDRWVLIKIRGVIGNTAPAPNVQKQPGFTVASLDIVQKKYWRYFPLSGSPYISRGYVDNSALATDLDAAMIVDPAQEDGEAPTT